MTTTEPTSVELTTAPQTEAPSLGLTEHAAVKVRALLDQEGRDDLRLRVAVQPGGCSGLQYQLFFDERSLDGDLELELNLFRALSPTQALGAGLVVYADDRDMTEQAVNSVEFFRNESCGKCVPCRLGSQKLASLGSHLLNGEISSALWQEEILPLIKEMGKAIELASICGLGRSVPVPLMTVAAFFPDDIAKYLSRTRRALPAEPLGDRLCQ